MRELYVKVEWQNSPLSGELTKFTLGLDGEDLARVTVKPGEEGFFIDTPGIVVRRAVDIRRDALTGQVVYRTHETESVLKGEQRHTDRMKAVLERADRLQNNLMSRHCAGTEEWELVRSGFVELKEFIRKYTGGGEEREENHAD